MKGCKVSEFYPLPPDVRRRIEMWLKEHLVETADSDDIPCVVTHDGGEPDVRTFARFPPCGLSPAASAKLAASIGAMVEEPFANELNRWLERKGVDPVSVYKGAGVTKQVWAKLRSVSENSTESSRTAAAGAASRRVQEVQGHRAGACGRFQDDARRGRCVPGERGLRLLANIPP